jgi:2-phospho-L-lactate guanylyltransferase
VPGAELGGVVVVTETEAGRELASDYGALAIADPSAGLNAAISAGIEAIPPSALAALVLPGDVPLVQPEDVLAIVAAAADQSRLAVVVPDAAGQGTNALLLRPPGLMAPAFGEPSAERHLLAAQRVASAVRLELPRLALDVDDAGTLAAATAHSAAS